MGVVVTLLHQESCDMNVSSTSTLAAVVMVGLDCTQEDHLLLVHVVQAASVPVCLRPFSNTELIDIYQGVEFVHF